MESMTIFAISGCLLTACLVYVVMQVRFVGEKQAVADQLLKTQAEITQLKKTLKGYTRYRECLEVGKHALMEQLKPPIVRQVRQYVHVEPIARALFKLEQDATVVIKFEVEFLFSIDLNPADLDVTDIEHGIALKINRPVLMGEPQIKTLTQQVFSMKPVVDDRTLITFALNKFVPLAKRYGSAMSTEESVRTMCRMKALECLRDTLVKQSGVKQVGAIFVDFK
nr:hypothetical protein [uncultured Rhodoferax sp.]